MKKKLKVLALFDAIAPTTLDQDLSAELQTDDWKTEANVLGALAQLGWKPAKPRPRKVSTALRAYASMATSAAATSATRPPIFVSTRNAA